MHRDEILSHAGQAVGTLLLEPGAEMQHDSSPHVAPIGGADRQVQTASLVVVLAGSKFADFADANRPAYAWGDKLNN